DRFGKLAEAVVDRHLADGRLTAQAVQVRSNVVGLRIESLAIQGEAADVEGCRRDSNLLREREEREHERHDDGAQDDSKAVCPLSRADGRADAPAAKGRTLGDLR